MVKRTDLISLIIQKAGLPIEKNQLGYLSKRQLQSLLIFIENKNQELQKAYDALKRIYSKSNK